MALNKNRAYTQGIGRSTVIIPTGAGVDNDPDVGTRTPVAGLREDDIITNVTHVTAAGVESDKTSLLRTFRGAKTAISNMGGANTSLDYSAKTPQVTTIQYVVTAGTVGVVVTASGAAITATFASGALTRDIASAIRNHFSAGRIVSVNNTTGHDGSAAAIALGPYTLGLDPDGNTAAAVLGYNNNQGGTRPFHVIAQGVPDSDMIIEHTEVGVTASYTTTFADTDQAVTTVAYAAPAITVDLRTVATVPVATFAEIVAAINAKHTAEGSAFPFTAKLLPNPRGNDGTGVAVAAVSAAFTDVGLAAGVILFADLDEVASQTIFTVDRRDNTPTESNA